jgi:hypothetical protein
VNNSLRLPATKQVADNPLEEIIMKRLALSLASRVCIGAAIACFFCLSAFGQSTRGSLSGLVKDSAGAAISGATVTAKHVATGEEFRASSDAQGAFVFPSVPLGQFNVTIEASGFKRSEAQGVMVEVATPAKLSVALEVGQVSEAVVISGETQEVVNTTSPTLTNVINTRQVRDLPLPTRNPLDLARLQAGMAVVGITLAAPRSAGCAEPGRTSPRMASTPWTISSRPVPSSPSAPPRSIPQPRGHAQADRARKFLRRKHRRAALVAGEDLRTRRL